MSVHERIRRQRLAKGLSETELAERLGLTRSAIQQWENPGGTAPARKHQAAVAEVLGLTVSQLMNPDDDPEDAPAAVASTPGTAGAPAMGPVARYVTPLSPAAIELGTLFDLLPNETAEQIILRNVVYSETSRIIIDALRQPQPAPMHKPGAPAAAKTPGGAPHA